MSKFPLHDAALRVAQSQIGFHEVPLGSNSGPQVRKYQAATFLGGTGWPWCAAFVCWVWQQAGHPLPYRTASAYGLLNWARGAGWAKPSHDLIPGDLVVFNVGSGHVGVFERWSGSKIVTVDGNHNNMVAPAVRPHSVVAGGIHIPELPLKKPTSPPHVPKPYWVIATDEHGKRVLLFSKFATEKTVLGLLPRLLAKYGRAGITIQRGRERSK